MSSAGAEWVSAPTEIRSTPVAAISATLSSVTPPEASNSARPAVMATAFRRSAIVHVVEQHDVGAGLERLRQLVERRHFDLDAQGVRRPLPRQTDCARHAIRATDRCQVVVLDQHAIRQPEAVVVPPTVTHRRLLQRAQPRRRLSGVHDARLRFAHGVDVARGQGGHTGETLQQVQRDPLPGEQAPRRSLDRGNRSHRRDRVTIRDEGSEDNRRIDAAKDFARHLESGDDPRRLGQQPPPRLPPGRNGQRRGDIAPADVLSQRQVEQSRMP